MTGNDKIYYVSQFDNLVHNIYDVDHRIIDYGRSALIGVDTKTEDGLRVDEEVDLWTIKEVAEFF